MAKAGVHVGKGFASNVRSAPKVLRKAVNYLAPALGLVVLGFTIGHYMNTTYALQVNLNGTDLGYIQDESVFQQAEKNFKQRIVYAEDQEVMQMQPVYTVMAVNRNELLSSGQITDTLIQATGSEVAHASGLYIDNNFMGATVDGQELRQILTDMLDEYRAMSPSETVRFASEVKGAGRVVFKLQHCRFKQH